jgi:GNAT superfamily N-acetyltransferase
MGLSVRAATASDIATLVELMAEFHAESGRTLDRRRAAASFAALLADAALGAAWLVERDGEVAGHAVMTFRFGIDHGAAVAVLDDLFVRPAHRRHGAARAMLTAMLADCRRRGARALQVEVGRGNAAAQALYAGFGLRADTDDRQTLSANID